MTRQLLLPLLPAASFAAEDFREDPSNAEALRWLAAPASWPLARLALVGPAGTGKTHLLRATAAREGWEVLDGAALRGVAAPPRGGLAVDDADLAPEPEALLHLLNACAERGAALLLAGRQPPSRWHPRPPDLRSRLAATAQAALGPPSDALLEAVFAKHLADRQLALDPGLRGWILARLPREAAAMGEAAARLDRASFGRRRLTRPAAEAALSGLFGDGFVEPESGATQTATALL